MMIVRKVERYLRESGMTASAFGRAVAGDPGLVTDLRNGREPGRRLASRIDEFIGAGR